MNGYIAMHRVPVAMKVNYTWEWITKLLSLCSCYKK